MNDTDLQGQVVAYQTLIDQQKTLLLSTVNAQGEAEASYAPYVRDEDGVFYIYVSELASHTQNMLQKHHASILIIRSEKDSKNIFARERVTFQCKVLEVLVNSENYARQLLNMEQQLGETMALLRSLPDFHLLALKPVSGKYIAGFGKAYSIGLGRLSKNISIVID